MGRVLVTGGAGFLGSHLVELLIGQGHDVTALDCLWTGSLDSIKQFTKHESFHFVMHDVREPFPPDLYATQIYHLACPASPDRFEEDPLKILETCFQGTVNVLNFARKCNARVLLASTSEVYGDSLVHPQSEAYWGNVNPFGPRSCYDEGKRVAESLAYSYRKLYDVDICIARIFNAYGPRMRLDDGRAVSNFFTAALSGRDICINGDGKSTRCFQYATDCVRGLVLLAESTQVGPINIGSDVETTLEELAQMILDIVSRKTGIKTPCSVNLGPAKLDDPVKRRPDVTLARELLGWEAKVGLAEGLEISADWYATFISTRRSENENHTSQASL